MSTHPEMVTRPGAMTAIPETEGVAEAKPGAATTDGREVVATRIDGLDRDRPAVTKGEANEAEEADADPGADTDGIGAIDGGAGRRRSGGRGVRKFDGLVDPTSLLAQMAVTAVLPPRVVRLLRDAKPAVIVITVPSAAWVGPTKAVIARVSGAKAVCLAKASRPRASAMSDPDVEAAEHIAGGHPVVAVAPDRTWIAPVLLAAADEQVDLPPPDAALVDRAIGMWCGRRPHRPLAPADLAGLDLPDLAAALRLEASPAACVARIRRASRARVGLPDGEAVTPLDRLTGYGEAHAWAIRTAADLARVRRGEMNAALLEGAVLYGPPGTGKSTLARSLAQAAGVVFGETSVGAWFADSPGFLDSVIKQISAFCDRLEIAAKQQGGAVGFLDELDALPNRARLDDRGASWWLPAITFCLLRFEQLRRAGVVLVAATNDLSRVDAALLRPGRFDRAFLIGPPDEAGRLGILRVHLVLQPCFKSLALYGRLFRLQGSSSPVGLLGALLMAASPDGPAQDRGWFGPGQPDEGGEQVPDLGNSQRQKIRGAVLRQSTPRRPPCAGRRGRHGRASPG